MSPRVNPDREIFRSPIVQYAQAVIELGEPLPTDAHAHLLDTARRALPDATMQLATGWRQGPDGPDPMLFSLASAGDGVVLFSYAVIAETVRYERYERFLNHVQQSVELISVVPGVSPVSVNLRYVDEIRLPNPEPTLQDFARYVTFCVHPDGALGQQATRGAGAWTLASREGTAVELEWAYTDAVAVGPGHPLAPWYERPGRPVLVLDWSCRREIGPAADLTTAVGSAYSAIKECFEAVVTDDCRALMRQEAT